MSHCEVKTETLERERKIAKKINYVTNIQQYASTKSIKHVLDLLFSGYIRMHDPNIIDYFPQNMMNLTDIYCANISISHFEILEIIGQGHIADINLVRYKNDDNKLYAMKSMLKTKVREKNYINYIKNERDLMVKATNMNLCTFLPELHFSFQDDKYLYLVMHFCGGCDLMTILLREDIINEQQTRFYIAELAVAVHTIHELGFVNRDIKPDNILIDNDGHIKLSDFGYSTKVCDQEIDENIFKYHNRKHVISNIEKKTFERNRKLMYSEIGTPDYIAPEIFSQKGYDEMVDWWSIGVIMFECLVGYPPFFAEEPLETSRKIMHYKEYFKIPSEADLSENCQDLIRNLIRGKDKRYGFEKVRCHPFFNELNFRELYKMKAPFIPDMSSDDDTRNFEEYTAKHDILSQLKYAQRKTVEDDDKWNDFKWFFYCQ